MPRGIHTSVAAPAGGEAFLSIKTALHEEERESFTGVPVSSLRKETSSMGIFT